MSGLVSNYKFLKEHSLIVEYHSGTLDVDSLINYMQQLLLEPFFTPDLNYFVYLKNVTFTSTRKDVTKYIEDITKYVNFLEINSKAFGNRRVALITNTPNHLIPTTLFKMTPSKNLKNIEIFSTNEHALRWLKTAISSEEINDVLLQLMNN